MLIFYIIIFWLGLAIGSFFNVVLARLDKKSGILIGRSECPNCHVKLKWFDLIPVLSFVMLKGRCRYCHKSISYSYPLVELITAGILLVFILKNGSYSNSYLLFFIFYLLGFLLLGFFDFKFMILPDKIVIPLILIAFIRAVLMGKLFLAYALLAGFIMAGLFAIMYVVSSGRWIGFGDVKLVFLIGLIFSYPASIFVVMFAIWAAALVGICLMLLGKATPKTAIPLGSFLSAVSVIYIIFQNVFGIFYRFFYF